MLENLREQNFIESNLFCPDEIYTYQQKYTDLGCPKSIGLICSHICTLTFRYGTPFLITTYSPQFKRYWVPKMLLKHSYSNLEYHTSSEIIYLTHCSGRYLPKGLFVASSMTCSSLWRDFLLFWQAQLIRPNKCFDEYSLN